MAVSLPLFVDLRVAQGTFLNLTAPVEIVGFETVRYLFILRVSLSRLTVSKLHFIELITWQYLGLLKSLVLLPVQIKTITVWSVV